MLSSNVSLGCDFCTWRVRHLRRRCMFTLHVSHHPLDVLQRAERLNLFSPPMLDGACHSAEARLQGKAGGNLEALQRTGLFMRLLPLKATRVWPKKVAAKPSRRVSAHLLDCCPRRLCRGGGRGWDANRVASHDQWCVDAAGGIPVNPVFRVRARPRGGMQSAEGNFGQWTCTDPQCGPTKCWPKRSRFFRCGAPSSSGGDPQPDPGRLPHPPPVWHSRDQSHLGRPTPLTERFSSTLSKRTRDT